MPEAFANNARPDGPDGWGPLPPETPDTRTAHEIMGAVIYHLREAQVAQSHPGLEERFRFHIGEAHRQIQLVKIEEIA